MLSRPTAASSLCVDCALLRHSRIARWRGRTVRLVTVTSAALDAPSPEAWLRGSVLPSAVRECLTSSRGGLDRALKLLVSSNDGADRIDVETGSQLLTLLCRERELRLRDVELVLSRLDGLNVTPAAARLVLRVFLAAEQTERAVTLFREFQAAGVELMPSTYTDLIAALARRHATSHPSGSATAGSAALALWEEIRGSNRPLDEAAFNAAASAYLATGQVQRADELLVDMDRLGLSPGIRMYNILLTAAGRARDLARVESVIDMMREARVPPDETTHGAMVSALVRCGKLERADRALREAQLVTPPPGVRAYTALVQGYAAAGDFDAALSIIAIMRSCGVEPNVVTYTTLMDGLVRADRLADATELLGGVRNQNIRANAVMFNTLLRGHARRGRLQDAMLLLARMTKQGVKPSLVTFNTLLMACSRAGDMGAAKRVVSRMRAAGFTPNVITATTLISVASRVGDVEAASTFFFEAVDQWRLVLDAPAYNAMLTCLAFANRPDEAAAILSCMRLAGVQPTLASFGPLIASAARAGNLDGALAAYRDACSSGLVPDVRMYDVLLDACVRSSRFEMGVDLLSDMEKRGTSLPEDVRAKYRRMLLSLVDTSAPLSMRGTTGRTASASRQVPSRRVVIPAGVERLKWWFGLPSNYYEN